ncbi:MAG TPA: DoxX family protein [Puia sp.]|nr:DoxX family protein [Puia sp.]
MPDSLTPDHKMIFKLNNFTGVKYKQQYGNLDHPVCFFWTMPAGQVSVNFMINKENSMGNPLYKLPSVYLRLAIGSAYLWEVADRLGLIGAPGKPHVGWGDWQHFLDYARQVMGFLPVGWIPALAVFATIGEAVFGALLIIGLFTRIAAIGSGLLSFCFALAMAISFGIESPLGYSVFTLSAASFLLAGLPNYRWSIDSWRGV